MGIGRGHPGDMGGGGLGRVRGVWGESREGGVSQRCHRLQGPPRAGRGVTVGTWGGGRAPRERAAEGNGPG